MSKTNKRIYPFIDGRFVTSSLETTIGCFDPTLEMLLAEVSVCDQSYIESAVSSAKRAFESGYWSRLSPLNRSVVLNRIADALEDNAKTLARLETQDTGLPLTLTEGGHIPRAIAHFRYFATEAERDVGEVYSTLGAYRQMVTRLPVGVVAVYAPWNAPLAVASMNVAAALAYGNSCILKPSELSPLTANALAEIISQMDLPPGVFNVVYGPGKPTGECLAKHKDVDRIIFVGSTNTGRKILHAAADRIGRVALELGGNAPAIVFDDANIDTTIDGLLLSSFANNGEVCTSSRRIYLQSGIYKSIVEEFSHRTQSLCIGNPLNTETEIGPLISDEHRQAIEKVIDRAIQQGAKLLVGGQRPKRVKRGFFLEPTVLVHQDREPKILREEVFGPVVTISPFSSEEEVIQRANDTIYGLAAYVYTSDYAKGLRLSSLLRSGSISIDGPLIRDYRVPFGGMRYSGLGRVGGRYSVDIVTELQTVCIPERRLGLPRLGLSRHVT